jgi:hypothetical protein
VVAIDVTRIRGVMNAMMRRGVQDEFQRSQRSNQFSVNPELV